MDQIIYLKLLNGEDIVAILLEETAESAIITYPLLIKTLLNPLNSMQYSTFFSWIPIKEISCSKFTISKQNIIAMIEGPESIIKAYNEFFKNSANSDNQEDSLEGGSSEEDSSEEDSSEDDSSQEMPSIDISDDMFGMRKNRSRTIH